MHARLPLIDAPSRAVVLPGGTGRIKQRPEVRCNCCQLNLRLPVLWRSGAASCYSCLTAPVETSTDPWRQQIQLPFYRRLYPSSVKSSSHFPARAVFLQIHSEVHMILHECIFNFALFLLQFLQTAPPEATMPLTDQPNMPRCAAGRKDVS